MRSIFLVFFSLLLFNTFAQKAEYLIVITSDGVRWQDVFTGMDSTLSRSKKYHEGDSLNIHQKFYADNVHERRKKLMPFLWTNIATNGQIYGNRLLNNFVNNANPYWFSYPGYSEIFTGFVDTAINTNDYQPNPNITILEYLQQQPKYHNKVAAFGAWTAFDRILNEKRSGIPVMSAYDPAGAFNPSSSQKLIDKMLSETNRPWGAEECLDVFTHHAAMTYLKEKKPDVLYIAYGETDEWAHASKYSSYLKAMNQVDKWIAEIWAFIQQDPKYKNKTALLFTTDHGRGDEIKSEWTSHGAKIKGANQIWMALLGPGIKPLGEVNKPQQHFQQQAAQTMAEMLGLSFITNHPVAPALPFKQ